jgi:hypothetical protein
VAGHFLAPLRLAGFVRVRPNQFIYARAPRSLTAPSNRFAQLLLCFLICVGAHVLITWGQLSNWADHELVDVCLFRWAHPAGFHGLGTSLAEAMPVDATLTAFLACLGAMRRIDDVQRGVAPHVAPDALHRGPLALLFPRGARALPRLSCLLSVTLVWGVLWGALTLAVLTAVWAASTPPRSLCMPGWAYVGARAAWSTVEALLVSAGSYVLW